ncbi:MAG TPA: FIST N-terminal domain-containing protein, partial [Azonexus sp.]|nr:FIST N-terminal domain-containing protein [Azonexus sp.]
MSNQASGACIRIGQSSAENSVDAVKEFFQAIQQEKTALVVFFCSPKFDLDVLSSELNRRFAGVPVIGCTTAGEIGPAGYISGSLTGFSLPSASFTVATDLLTDLQNFEVGQGQALTQALRQKIEGNAPESKVSNSFAFLLIDGLSIREESVARAIQSELGRIPLFGGSAGDDLKFERTWVFHQGAFHTDAALLTLINTSLPFQAFKTQH